jgi:hypothetical protein
MKEKPLIFIDKIEKIEFFDVLVEDIHSAGEKSNHHCLEGSSKLTYHEVWEWISRGGDWSFIVTEHNNPEKVFMRGSAYEDMDAARKGEHQLSLGQVTDAELSDLQKLLHRKRKEQYGIK